MRYFRECPICGAHLDPGESCDCGEKHTKEEKADEKRKREAEAQKSFRVRNSIRV